MPEGSEQERFAKKASKMDFFHGFRASVRAPLGE